MNAIYSRETSNSNPLGTKRTPATARMPATVRKKATVVTLATTVAPATSNSKDDSNIMTAHKSRNASNMRNKSDNRTGNTVLMIATAGMLFKSEKTAAAGTIASSWMSSAAGPLE
jgi:hypothetical protein